MVFCHWLLARISALFWRTDTVPASIVSGMTLMGWSIILVASDVFEARNLYDYLGAVAPAHLWSGLTAVVGVAQLIYALMPHDYMDARLQRIAIWIAAGTFWLYIASIAVLAVPVTTMAATAAVLMIACLWGLIRESER